MQRFGNRFVNSLIIEIEEGTQRLEEGYKDTVWSNNPEKLFQTKCNLLNYAPTRPQRICHSPDGTIFDL